MPGGARRTLHAPDLSVRYTGLPVGATCVLTETGTGGADRTTWTVSVDGRADVTGSGVTIPVAGLSTTTEPGQAVVHLVNTFDAQDTLARTGADVGRTVGLLALLVTVGIGLVVLRRRRA